MLEESKPTDRFAAGLTSFVTFRLARVQNRLNVQATATLSAHSDLSLTEWRMISLINASGETSAADLSRTAQMDKGQISRALKSLAAKGYIASRTSASDQRQSLLRLSAEGAAVHRRLVAIMRRRQERLTDTMSDAELATFYAALEKLEAAAMEPVI
ncbi:MAG: MarR family transcriptional regulator [Pseudomonadota bacterium]